jgi:Fe-S-cluster containining protein
MPDATMADLPVINCDGCGACCTGMTMPPFVPVAGEQEWEAFRLANPDLAVEIDAEYERMRAEDGWHNGPCFWFDVETRKCKHYEERPEICQDFELGGEACLDWRRIMGLWILPGGTT